MRPLSAAIILACAVVVTSQAVEPQATYRFQGNLDSEQSVKDKLFVPLPAHNEFKKIEMKGVDGEPVLTTTLYKFAGNNGPDLNISLAPRKEYTLAFLLSLDSVEDVHLLDLKTLMEYKDGHDLNIVDGMLVAQTCVQHDCSSIETLPDTPKVMPGTMNMFVLTREKSSIVRIYLNNREIMTFNDESGGFVLSQRIFFLQDDFWGEQTSSGYMASIRLFSAPLTPDEVMTSLSDDETAILGKRFGKSGLIVDDKPKAKVDDQNVTQGELKKLTGLVEQKNVDLHKDEQTIASLKIQVNALKSELKAKDAKLDDVQEKLSKLQENAEEKNADSAASLYRCEAGWAKANLTISELRSKLATSAGALNATAADLAIDEKRILLAEGKSVGLEGEVSSLTTKLKQVQKTEEGEKAALQVEMDEDVKLRKKGAEKDERVAVLLEKLKKANETITNLEVTGSDDEKILAYVGKVRKIVENRKEHEDEKGAAEDDAESSDALVAETNSYAPVLIGCTSDKLTTGYESVKISLEGNNRPLTSPANCASLCREKDASYTYVGVRYGGLMCVCAHDGDLPKVQHEQCTLLCSNGSECGSEKDNIFSLYKIV